MNRHCLLILAVALGLAGVRQSQAQPLSGLYTVGSAPSDYPTISSAVADLNSNGISAPVTFRLKAGTYDEQVTITDFGRAGSATDGVTFRPFASASVTWQYTAAFATTNWVVKADSARYITFSGIDFVASGASGQYGRLVVIENGSSNITITDCSLTGHLGQVGTGGVLVWIVGKTGVPPIKGITVSNSQFTWGSRGIRQDFQQAQEVLIKGNTFSGQTEYGVSLDVGGTATIDSNFVYSAAWSGPTFVGISSEGSFHISRNTVDMQKGWAGIWVSTINVGAVAGTRLIENNLVAVRDPSADRGLVIATDSVRVRHNTVRLASPGASLFVFEGFSGVRLRGNILVNDRAGLAMDVRVPASLASSDYNVFYSSGPNIIAWDFTGYADLLSYRAGESLDFDEFSHVGPVTFVDTTGTNDLHLASPSDTSIDLLAPSIADLTEDVDGNARGAHSMYRGGDEGVAKLPLDNDDTVPGYYTVGGSSPDFASPSIAIRNLNYRGIKGSVTFRIRSGTYPVNDIIKFQNHSDAEAASIDTVLFRADTPASRPTLQHSASSSYDNWVVRVEGMDEVGFWNVNLEANGTPPWGRVIELTGDVDHFVLSQCTVSGIESETAVSAAIVYADTVGQSMHVFSDCLFQDGSHGLYLMSPDIVSELTSIVSNTFDGQAVSAVRTDHEDIDLSGNEVASSHPGVVGFDLDGAQEPTVTGNKIHVTGSGADGMHLVRGNFNPLHALIANNFISATAVGLGLQHNARVYHNSIRAGSEALRMDVDPGIPGSSNIFDNILANTGSGPALYVADASDVDTTDFNNLTNAGGGTLVHWDGADYPTLNAYKLAEGRDIHSTGVAPDFVNAGNGNLHLTGTSIANPGFSGIPLPDVTDDIDGDLRSPLVPYMGADEPPTPLVITGDIKIALEGAFNGTTMDTTLKTAGFIPATHPFGGFPWFHPGFESFSEIPAGTVDWVLVDIRSTTSPASIVARRAGLLLNDGSIVDTTGTSLAFWVAPPGDYYIVVWHRNHIPAMSAEEVTFGAAPASFDFTAADQAYTTGPPAMKDLGGGLFGLAGGDANTDGQIIANDFNTWLVDTKAAATGYVASDFDLDGQVTASDFNLWLANTKVAFTSQVP